MSVSHATDLADQVERANTSGLTQWYSSTASGCCHTAGTAGLRGSSRRATRPFSPDGPMTPRLSSEANAHP